MGDSNETRWLLLVHQLPPKPGYLRVKIWRRLQRLGSVALKNSVYVLPNSDQATEDFQWLLREIVEGGGDASVCEARFVEGQSDEEVQALFHAARGADYAQIAEDARRVAEPLTPGLEADNARQAQAETEISRLKRRLAEVVSIDFFGAPGRETAEGLISGLEARVRNTPSGGPLGDTPSIHHEELRRRTWVTRKGLHVDRMASAWLIHRFIDPEARFKFVPARGYKPEATEVRFDMFDAEFTHEGDRCTFEVLIERLKLTDSALHTIAEIVHDIDLKDSKFGRHETVGIDRLIAGIAMAHKDDETRLSRASAVFDDLYVYFTRKRG